VALCLVLRPRSLRVGRRELGFLVLAGIVGIGLVQWFYFVAIARLPVGIALLLEYLAPVLVALWVRFVRGEQVRSRVWAWPSRCWLVSSPGSCSPRPCRPCSCWVPPSSFSASSWPGPRAGA
jgi:hypothetical protein